MNLRFNPNPESELPDYEVLSVYANEVGDPMITYLSNDPNYSAPHRRNEQTADLKFCVERYGSTLTPGPAGAKT